MEFGTYGFRVLQVSFCAGALVFLLALGCGLRRPLKRVLNGPMTPAVATTVAERRASENPLQTEGPQIQLVARGPSEHGLSNDDEGAAAGGHGV